MTDCNRKRLVYYPSFISTSELVPKGVRIKKELWDYVEQFAYENRIGKTVAFNTIIETFAKEHPISPPIKAEIARLRGSND